MRIRNKLSIGEIGHMSTNEIIKGLSLARISLLRSFGCGYLNFMYYWVRFACHHFLNEAEEMAHWSSAEIRIARKAALGRIFADGAPSKIEPSFPAFDKGVVMAFNHPSLGEIIRLMGICMQNYETKKYLFPVNIIWYEALAPVISRLRQYGFVLMPVVTPSARKTLMRRARTQEQKLAVDLLTKRLNRAYMKRAARFIEKKDIVLVAPSARRRRFIFRNAKEKNGLKAVEPQTITILTSHLLAKDLKFYILPVAVGVPWFAPKGLNLSLSYVVSPCPPHGITTIQSYYESREVRCSGRCLERSVLEKIAARLQEKKYGYMTYPGWKPEKVAK